MSLKYFWFRALYSVYLICITDGPSNFSLVAEEMVPWKEKLKYIMRASLVAQVVKNLSAMQETPVRFLCQEDPPGEGKGYPLQNSWAALGLR